MIKIELCILSPLSFTSCGSGFGKGTDAGPGEGNMDTDTDLDPTDQVVIHYRPVDQEHMVELSCMDLESGGEYP